MFFISLVENNQLICGFLVKNNAMQADDYERKINYDWPKQAPVEVGVDINAYTYEFIKSQASHVPWTVNLQNTPSFTFINLYD